MKKIIFILLLLPSVLFSQTVAEKSKIIQHSNTKALKKISQKYEAAFNSNKKRALQLAKINNWQTISKNKDSYSELIGLTYDNKPIYYTTYNQGAGITSRANKLYSGGGLGLSIHGENMLSAMWDAESALASHQLFSGRLHTMDNCPSTNSHSTHVAGTIIGTNTVQGGHAKGMAFKSRLHSYDWDNDGSEVAEAAAEGLLLSNHSYGYSPYAMQDYQWGKYDIKSEEFDDIMFNAPYYQFVCAAGNSRGNFNTPKNGFDLITGHGLSKNGITVAAVEEVLDYTGPNSVILSNTSSRGPADDGRIKPDISAKGVQTYSATDNSNHSYGNKSGTSMAAPSVTGTLLLLQQYYNQVHQTFLKASTLKGLMIHTADEAGPNPGPDYSFGWGLINAEKAANVITHQGIQSYIIENTLVQNESFSIDVNAIGSVPLVATLSWTDPKGNMHSLNVDDATPDLINDLDIRIIKQETTFFPWKLNASNPAGAATTGDNVVDNIEKTEISNASGNYLVTITHKGTLLGNSQNYSLIISGITLKGFWFSTAENQKNSCSGTDAVTYNFGLNFKGESSENITFSAINLLAGVSETFDPVALNTTGNFNLTLTNLSGVAPGNYPFIVRATSVSDVFELPVTLTILSPVLTPAVLLQPQDNSIAVNNPVPFSWDLDANAQNYTIEIAEDASFTTIIETAILTGNSYTSTLLHNDHIYFWRIRNSNQCNTGTYSAIHKFTTSCVAPENISVENITKTSAIMRWTGNSDAWRIAIVPVGNSPESGTLISSNEMAFNNLLPDTCYDFYIVANCSTGNLPWGEPMQFCTTPDYCNGAHFYDNGGASGNYTAEQNSTTVIYPDHSGDRVRAVFNDFELDDCCDYMIIFDGPDDTFPFLYFGSGTNSPGTIVSTHSSGALTFFFHSNDNNNRKGWDASVFCEPLPACPGIPTHFNLEAADTTSASIGWTENSGSDEWEVEIVSHNSVPTGTETSIIHSNPYTIPYLTPNTCYDFYVRSLCNAGTSVWAGPFSFCSKADYCGGDHFYDTGGQSGNYGNYEYETTVIAPDITGNRVRALFNSFEIDDCCDSFTVYNGPDHDSPVLYSSNGNNEAPTNLASTHSSGKLTVVFSSDGYHNYSGWDATIVCEPLPSCANPPSGITADAVTTSSATIEWLDSSDAESWQVQVVLQGILPGNNSTIIATNSQSFTALNSNTCYDFYVRSVCAEGNSEWSNPFTFCTAANYCGGDHFYDTGGANGNYLNEEYKTTVITPDITGNRVRAVFNSFEIESCCDRLKIYNGPDTSYPLLYNSGTNSNAPGTIVSTHTSGALTFRFSSNGDTTLSGWDAEIFCEPLPSCANTPSQIRTVLSSSTQRTISWNENSGANSWDIEIVAHNSVPSGLPTAFSTDTNYTALGLTPNACYDFYVRSVCNQGTSAWTQRYQFCTEPEYCEGSHFYDSGGVSGNYNNKEDKTTVIFPGVTGQRVRAIFNSYALESCCDYLKIYDGPDTSYPLLYNDAAVSPGSVASTDVSGALTFKFHSDDTSNESGWDASIICESVPTCPNPPTMLTGVNLSTESAVLSWTENASSNNWNVILLPQGTLPTGSGTSTDTNNYSISNLSSNTCYDFYVQSVCTNGTTGWAGPLTFCTSPDYCGGDHFYDTGGPNGEYPNNENKTTVIFPTQTGDKVMVVFNSFNLEGCCDYMKIYDGPNATYPMLYSGGHTSPGTLSSTDTSGALTFVFHSDSSSNGNGWDATISCAPLSVVSEFDAFPALNYFPNPVSMSITINACEKVKKYSVYGVDGKLIRESKINMEKFEIDLQQLSTGSYFIKLSNTDNKSRTIKILKN